MNKPFKKTYKNHITTLFAFLMLSLGMLVPSLLKAQNLAPESGTVMHNEMERPCLIVTLDPAPKDLRTAWKDYLKRNYDIKLKGGGLFSSNEMLSAERVRLESISDKNLDLFTQIVEKEEGSEMKVFAAFGYDVYADPVTRPDEFNAMEDVLENFMKVYLPKHYLSKVADTEAEIQQLAEKKLDIQQQLDENAEKMEALRSERKNLEIKLEANDIEIEMAENKMDRREEQLSNVRTELNDM